MGPHQSIGWGANVITKNDFQTHRPWKLKPIGPARYGVAAILGWAMVATAGCSDGGNGSDGVHGPTLPSEARGLCADFVTTALSIDTKTDRGPGEARTRAATRYGIPGLAEQFDGEGNDPAWAQLEQHNARVDVQIEPVDDDPPPVRADEASAAVLATRIAAGT